MKNTNWCIKCGRRIDAGDKICHHCGAKQRKYSFDVEPTDIQVVAARYDHLIYKQSTDGLTDSEYIEMVKLSKQLKG